MFKKAIAVISTILLIVTCLGVSAFAEIRTITTKTFVTDEAVIDQENPEKLSEVKYAHERYFLEGGTNNDDAEAEALQRVVIQKFDLSKYIYPVETAEFTYYYRDTTSGPDGCKWGDGNIMVFKASSNWDSETVTWSNYNGGEVCDVDKEGENYIANGPGDTAVNVTREGTIDVKEVINEALLAGEKEISFALARDKKTGADGKYANRKNSMRIITKNSKLSITVNEPVHKLSESETKVLFSDKSLINPDQPDTVQKFTNSEASYVDANGINAGQLGGADIDRYGKVRTNFIKFDLSNLEELSDIESIKLSFSASSRNRYYGVRFYIVDNDSWSGSTLVWNDVFPTNDETGEVEPTSYAPNTSKMAYSPSDYTNKVTGILYTSASNAYTTQGPYDVTDIVKNELISKGGDGVVTLAVMIDNPTHYGYNGRFEEYSGGVRIKFNETTGPHLTIKYKEAGTSIADDAVSFKQGGENAGALTVGEGVVSAEIEVLNTMYKDTNATAVMCIYEGDKLAGFYTDIQKINGAKVNDGKTTLSISTPEAINVTEDTKVKVFLWSSFYLYTPVMKSISITTEGIQ